MSKRSAPFVAPDHIEDPTSKDGRKHAKVLLSTLQEDIARFRNEQFPPDILRQIRDMPIYEGNLAEVQAYQHDWQPLLERAVAFYPAANLPPDYLFCRIHHVHHQNAAHVYEQHFDEKNDWK